MWWKQRIHLFCSVKYIHVILVHMLVFSFAGRAEVLELFNDQANFADLLYWDLNGRASITSMDPFIGNVALKVVTETNVADSKIFSPTLEDCTNYFHWEYFIDENPSLSEYRYLMFSWKDVGGPGKMALYLYQGNGQGTNTLQVCFGSWLPSYNRLVLPTDAPQDWETVTVDLYEQFGPALITGIGFYWYRGGRNPETSYGLFDNIYLGSSISELQELIPTSQKIKDLFDRTGSLSGSTPNMQISNEVWQTVVSGADDWVTDGSTACIASGAGTDNAYLSFSPDTGHLYLLSVDISVTESDPSRTTDWMGLAFMESAVSGQMFAADACGVLLRRNGSGITLMKDRGNIGFSVEGDSAQFQILLDTTSVNWRIDWFVNGELVRNEVFLDPPIITHIGIGNIASAGGTVDNFTLNGN